MTSKTMNASAVKLLLVSGTMASITSALLAAPQGEQVVRGNVNFARNGDLTRIWASNGAIINYRQFNIAANETVQFIQPSSRSRVLNRVLDKDPTQIAGTLLANGKVYIVNPAGISIRNGAVVDVGGLYAAAGNISDQDFARGINRFTGLTGNVTNEGTITGAEVILTGVGVHNAGTINSPNGYVAMAAGNDVLVGEAGGTMFVRVQGAAPGAQTPQGAGVQNTGNINAAGGTYAAATGDMFAMAIMQGGNTTARNVSIQGGNNTVAWVEGKIDATSASNGGTSGGTVNVRGEHVVLTERADIDASGANQGGTVTLGGGWQGQGGGLNSQSTTMATGAAVRANATEAGHGGTIAVWSDGNTIVGGELSATGAGEQGWGGKIETSGKLTLSVYESAKVNAGGAAKNGLWLLDPQTMNIINGGILDSTNVNIIGGPPVEFEPDNDAITASVTIGLINFALAAGNDVLITTRAPGNATVTDGNINWTATQNLVVDVAGLELRLEANNNINFTGSVNITGTATDTFTMVWLSNLDTDGTGSGGSGATITIAGAMNIADATFTTIGQNFQLTQTGSITATGDGEMAFLAGGDINIQGVLSSVDGDIVIGDILFLSTDSITVTNPAGASITTSGAGSIFFAGDTTLTQNPTINATGGGTIEFGGGTLDSSLTINSDQVIGSAGTSLVQFNGDVRSQAGGFYDLTVTATDIEFQGAPGAVGLSVGVGNNDIGVLTLNTGFGGRTLFADTVTVGAGQIDINGDVVLAGSGIVLLDADNDSGVASQNITINGDITSTDSLVGGTPDETPFDFNPGNIGTINGNVGQGGAINVLGAVRFFDGSSDGNAVVVMNSTAWAVRSLDADTIVRVDNGGLALNIASDNSIFRFELQTTSNLVDLSFTSGGGSFANAVDFRGNVGSTDAGVGIVPFGSIRVGDPGQLSATTTVRGVTVNTTNAGGATGNQDYEGEFIVSGGGNALNTLNSTGGDVRFYHLINDDITGFDQDNDLTVNAQNVFFEGLIGSGPIAHDLGDLNVTAVDDIEFSFTGSSTTGINVFNTITFTATRVLLATEGEFSIYSAFGSTFPNVTFNADIQDAGNGTDWMNVTGGYILFNGDIGTGTDQAIGRLIVTGTTIEFRSTVLSTDAGPFDGDQIYNGPVLLNSPGREHRFAYIGSVHALGTSADLGATLATIDPTFGFGDISFRGTINSIGTFANTQNGMLVETSGRREFQQSIGNGGTNQRLAYLITGGDANIAGADPNANPGIDLLGDSAGSAITINTFADGSVFLLPGAGSGNISFWGPTYLDNDVTIDLFRDGVFTSDAVGQRELTFRRTLDSFDTTLRNLDVTNSFRTWFRDDVGEQNTSGGAVPNASRLSTADITASEIFTIAAGSTVNPWIRLGSEDDGGGNWFDFKTNSPAGVDVVAQRYNGPVRLDAQVDVDDDNNGDIIFESTVDSLSSNLQTLEVKTGGRGWFRGNVGFDFNPLDRLITDSDDETEGVDGTYFGFGGNTIFVRAANTGTSAAFGAVANAAIEIGDDLFLDGHAIVQLMDAAGVLTGGGVNFRDDINSSIGFDPDLHGLTVFSSGTTMFFDDIGQQRALFHLITDVPGFSRFGAQNGGTGNIMFVTTNGLTTDIGDPVSLDADTVFTELNDASVLRFRGSINSFNDTFRALRLLTPDDGATIGPVGARTELWGNIGTGFIASGSGGDPDGSSGVPNDGVNRALRFIQTDGFGITQLGNNSDNDAADVRNAQITIRTAGDPSGGDITSNGFNAIDMQDAVLLDASYTFDTQNARDLRFYETIDSVVRVGGDNLTATNRSLTINNSSGNIAFDDNIGTLVGAFGNGRLLFILTDTDAGGNSGTIRLGNASGQFNVLNGFSNGAATNVADGPAINIQTSGASGVQLGDQFINLDADIEIDATNSGTVNFGANALTGFVNSQDRSVAPGVNTDLNSAANGDDIYRGLTINTAGATRFFNTVGAQSFTAPGLGLRRLAYIRTDYVLNTETGSVGLGTTRFDSNVFVQGRESAQSGPASSVAGQQRRIAMTINDSMIIGDNVNNGTSNGVTIDSLIIGGYTGTGGGALRFRGNVITDGSQRDLFLFTNAQTLTRTQYFSMSQSDRNNWVANMLAPVAFGGDVGSSGGRFQSFTINQPDASPFGVRGTGQSSDAGNVPVVSTIFWADGGSAWGTDDAWSLTESSVGALDSALNTTTFDVWTSGRSASGGRIVGIDFGQNELGTAFGNLELKSSTGQIFIGDLNAVGAEGRGATSGRLIVGEIGNSFVCSDDQKTIMVRTRTGGRTVYFKGSNLASRRNQGTDFVANRIIFRTTPGLIKPSLNAEGGVSKHAIQFSTPDGGHVTIKGDDNPPFIVRRFGEELYERQFTNNFNSTVHLFDLPAKGMSQAEKATAWSKEGWLSAPHEVWPTNMSHFDDFTDMEGTVGDTVLLNNAERKSLEGINVMTRTQTAAQMMDNMIGREFFNDRPNAADAASASDLARAVSLPRLNRKAATALAAEAQKILGGSGDTAKAMALVDQLGITPTEAAAMKASIQRRAGVPAK